MAEKLLKLATPQDPIQELIKKRDTASQEELSASQKVTELETKRAQNEAERAATQAKAKEQATTELTARQTERETPIKEEKSSIDKQLMNAHFEPSKENLESQVALFSLINVIGFAIGAGGKENAQQAMSAMNGMLEGHQKGREDVFKQEKVKFDENFKALQSKATFLENELRHSLEEFTRDKRAADERAAAAFAEAGADFMKTYAEKNGLVAAYERAKEVRRAADKAVTDEQRRQERIQDKLEAEARAEAQRVIDDQRRLAERKDFARFAASLKGGGGGAGAGASGISAKELFEDAAKAIANYAEKPPALRDPQRNALLARARQINPTYNEAGYGDRDIAYRNWTNPNGYGAKQIAAFTTVAGHLATLDKLGTALDNNDTQAINSAYNWFKTATGDPTVTNFNAAKQAVAAETIKAITGTAGALRDREEAQAIFGAVQSPAQLKGAINTVKELINSRLETSKAMFEAGTGRKNFEELLPPVVKQTFQGGRGGYQAAAVPALTGAAAIPTGAAKPSSQQVDIKTYPVIGTTPDGRPVHRAPDGKKYVE
jgi:hypothetical protein